MSLSEYRHSASYVQGTVPVDDDAGDNDAVHFLSVHQALPPDIVWLTPMTILTLCPNITSPEKPSLTTLSRRASLPCHSPPFYPIFFPSQHMKFPDIILLLVSHLPPLLEM